MRQKGLDKISNKTKSLAELVSAILVIGGAAVGLCSWASSQFANAVSAQISDFRDEVKAANDKQDQQITRLELMNLIQTQPTNKAAIEKMARYYFVNLNGDLYMTGMYSEWCEQYGGDASIVVGTH